MSVRLALVLALSTIVTASAAADAPPAAWSRSMMTAAPSYFPAHASVMVVGVGDGAQPAAAALVETLQMSDAFEYAIDGKGLGKVDGLADADIVKRAFTRPLKRLAIVRVFPAGASVKAVVTIYGAQGQVTTAFTLAPGKALVDNPTPESADEGVRTDQLQVVKSATGNASDQTDDIRYERQAITGVSAYGVFTFENVSFFKNGRLIADTPGLYEALGMADKATAYRDQASGFRKAAGWGITLDTIGTLGLLSFGIWALVPGSHQDAKTNTYVANDNTLPLALTAGSAGMILIGTWLIASHHAPKNLTADEAIALVDAHNKKKKATVQLHVAPSATPSSAGLVLGGSF